MHDIAFQVTSVKFAQPSNAEAPTEVTDAGIVKDVTPVMPWHR